MSDQSFLRDFNWPRRTEVAALVAALLLFVALPWFAGILWLCGVNPWW